MAPNKLFVYLNPTVDHNGAVQVAYNSVQLRLVYKYEIFICLDLVIVKKKKNVSSWGWGWWEGGGIKLVHICVGQGGIHAKVCQNQTDAGSISAQFSPCSGHIFYRLIFSKWSKVK